MEKSAIIAAHKPSRIGHIVLICGAVLGSVAATAPAQSADFYPYPNQYPYERTAYRAITDILETATPAAAARAATHAVTRAVIGRTYGPLLWLSGIGTTGSAGTPTPSVIPIIPMATRAVTPLIPMATRAVTPLIPMATRVVTPLIPVATRVERGRISDSEACSIRNLRFRTNTERRRNLPTNMRHRHGLDTTTRRRRGRP